jgi:hypothetical protein
MESGFLDITVAGYSIRIQGHNGWRSLDKNSTQVTGIDYKYVDWLGLKDVGGGKQFNSPDTGAIVNSKNFDLLYNDTGRYHDILLPPATVYLQPVLYQNFNYMADKTEYGLDLSVAPDATDQDIVAITQLYLRLNMK